MKSDLKKIKKYYGEEMMHLCRELFPTILEEEGSLLKIMETTFPHSRFLYDDIIKDNQITTFKDFIYDKYGTKEEEKKVPEVFISPFDLMEKAGYTLYECYSEDDIQKFKKYYAENEALCTFAGGRLDTSLVFFAVKKNVDEIKREDFPDPQRQDAYGTSVLSIQYRRGAKNTLSIKNRYNHAVDNPDATFGNNLDEIIDGLNDSFERAYNLAYTGSREKFELSKYIRVTDGKYYKCNCEVNGVYYGPDNVIIDNFEVVERYKEKEKYLIIDNIIIDLVNKRILTYDNSDKYIESLNNISKIEVLNISNTGDKEATLTMNNGKKVIFSINKYNRIIKINDEYTCEIPDDSLLHLDYLKELSMSNVTKCGNNFLLNSSALRKIDMPLVESIGDSFLRTNVCLKELVFPKLKVVGNCFIRIGDMLKELYLPSLEVIGDNFLDLNRHIEKVNLPNVKNIGSWFLSMNNKISTIDIPNLERVANNFLANNRIIKHIYFPELMSVGNCFFLNSMAEEVDLPNLIQIGHRFMTSNCVIDTISLPKVVKIGDFFISDNQIIKTIDLPNLVIVGSCFLRSNEKVTEVILPNLELCENEFMFYNGIVNYIYLPKIQYIGDRFLAFNYKIRKMALEHMEQVDTENGRKYVRKR